MLQMSRKNNTSANLVKRSWLPNSFSPKGTRVLGEMILSGAEVGKVQDEYRIFGYLKKIRVLQT